MPRLQDLTPKYRKHKASGQAVVTICGRDHDLGPHGTKASRREYDRLISEWLAVGRLDAQATKDSSVAELLAGYDKYARPYCGNESAETRNNKTLCKRLRKHCADTNVNEFGPLKLKAFCEGLVA